MSLLAELFDLATAIQGGDTSDQPFKRYLELGRRLLTPYLHQRFGDSLQERGCQPWEVAENVAEDQYLLLLKPGGVELRTPAQYWVFVRTDAKRKALDVIAREPIQVHNELHRIETEAVRQPEAPPGASFENLLLAAEWECIQSLSDPLYDILYARLHGSEEDTPYSELARVHGITEETARKRYFDAKKAIRRCLCRKSPSLLCAHAQGVVTLCLDEFDESKPGPFCPAGPKNAHDIPLLADSEWAGTLAEIINCLRPSFMTDDITDDSEHAIRMKAMIPVSDEADALAASLGQEVRVLGRQAAERLPEPCGSFSAHFEDVCLLLFCCTVLMENPASISPASAKKARSLLLRTLQERGATTLPYWYEGVSRAVENADEMLTQMKDEARRIALSRRFTNWLRAGALAAEAVSPEWCLASAFGSREESQETISALGHGVLASAMKTALAGRIES